MFKAEHPRNFWGLLNKDELCLQKKKKKKGRKKEKERKGGSMYL